MIDIVSAPKMEEKNASKQEKYMDTYKPGGRHARSARIDSMEVNNSK